jgi:hypothetical protein
VKQRTRDRNQNKDIRGDMKVETLKEKVVNLRIL